MATFAQLLARRGHEAWLSLQVAGLGPLTAATAASQAFRFSSGIIDGTSDGSIDVASVIPSLVGLPSAITERADLQAGSTDLSALSIGLRGDALLPSGAHLDSLWHVPLRSRGWRLAADCTAAAVSITVDPLDGAYPVVGQALFLGGETVVVTGVAAAPALDVARGMYLSTARAHTAGNGVALYATPQHLRGRRVWLRLNFRAPEYAAAYVLPASEEEILWTGTLDEWEVRDRGVITISCASALGRLDRCLLRQQWEGVAYGFERAGGPRSQLVPLRCSVDVSPEADQRVPGGAPILSVDAARPGWYRDFYARLGKQLVQARYWTSAEADVAPSSVEILALGCQGTDASELEDGWDSDLTLEIREVWPSSPHAREKYLDGSDPLCPFTLDGDTVPTTHPIDLALTLALSTGTAGGSGDWDVLPERLGLGLAEADFDLASWRRLKEETANLSYPNLIFGWDGKPFSYRGWLQQEILGPMGWFVRVTTDGTYSIGAIGDVYPGDTVASLAYAEVIEGSFSMRGGLPDTVSLQTWSYGWDWSTETFTRIRKYIAETARDRLLDDDSEIQIECRGIEGSEATGASMIAHRALQFSWWWAAPLPRLGISVRLDRFPSLAIGDLVDLSSLDLPIFTDATVYGIIVSRGIDLQGAKLDLELYLIPSINTALWCPSGTVAAWNAGTLELTLEHDHFTDAATGDAGQFQDGQWLMITDSHGVPLCDVAAQIDIVSGDTIVLVAGWTIGGVDVVPVAGDIVTFCRVDSSAVPEHPWDTAQDGYAAQADSTLVPVTLPDGGAPVVYGG